MNSATTLKACNGVGTKGAAPVAAQLEAVYTLLIELADAAIESYVAAVGEEDGPAGPAENVRQP
jgi:hypothetical protein